MMKLIVKIIGISVLMLWLLGCSANYHLKQSEKHYNKALQKGYKPKSDTTFKKVQRITEGIKLDTFMPPEIQTTTIIKERLRIDYKRDTINNVVYFEAECQPDTIELTVPVEVKRTAYIRENLLDRLKWYHYIVFIGIIFLLLKIRIN